MASVSLRVVFMLACSSVTRAQVHSSGKRSLAKCDPESAGCVPKTSILLQQDRQTTAYTEQALGEMSSNLGAYQQIFQKGSPQEQLSILAELLNQGKALPAAIKEFVDAIANQSVEVQKELGKEHSNQIGSLEAMYASMGACTTSFEAEIRKIQSTDGNSLKSQAESAKVTLCSCRERQAKVAVEAQQCKDTLECLKRELDSKESALNNYLDDNGVAADLYKKQGVCEDGTSWTQGSGSTAADKALQWIEDQRDFFNRRWTTTEQNLQALKAAFDLATAEYAGLQDGSLAGLTIKGCDALNRQSADVAAECRELQTRATFNQCTYKDSVELECRSYNSCHSGKVSEWSQEKDAETVNSQDRRDAWVAAEKIKCHTSAFYEEGGKLQINTSKTEECEKLTCASIGAACEQDLDMSAHLSKRPDPAAQCPQVGSPCSQGGWTPSCDAQQWRPYVPTAIKWNRTSSCSTQPSSVALVAPEDTCQACVGIAD